MRLLREAEFRRFWAGQTISLFGDQVTLLALPLAAVLVLDASAAEMGFLTAAALAPNLLLSLVAGAWVDRRERRRRMMIAADLGRAALVASVPVAHALGELTMAHLYAVAFLAGCLSVVFELAYPTLLVSVVPRRQLLDANGLLNQSRAVSFVAGPGIAGFLVQVFSAPVALLVDAASYVGSALFLGRIRTPERPPEEEERVGMRERVLEGMRFILASPIYRPSLGAVATINFFNFMFHALFILFATRELGVGPGALGAVLAAGAVGGVAGSLLAPPLARRIGIGPAYTIGCLLFPLPLVLVPLAAGPESLILALLFAAEFLSSVGVTVLDVNASSLHIAITPDRLRARVTGAHRFVNYGVRPLGSLAGGALGGAIGLRPTLWIATVGAVAGILWLLPSPVPALRELPEQA